MSGEQKEKRMRLMWVNAVIAGVFGIAAVIFWAVGNQPTAEPPWPAAVAGVSFSPLRMGNDPATGNYPTLKEIDEDLRLLAGKVQSVRTYGVGGTLKDIPRLARKYGISVTLGGWLTGNHQDNLREVRELIQIAQASPNVTQVVVGNEAVLRGELTAEQVSQYLDIVRSVVGVPVSTAEPWHVWIKNPVLVEHVDYIAAHMLPYWEGIALEAAVDFVVQNYNDLVTAFPGKRVIFAEVGWPSNGRTRRSSVASEANEAIFLRRFLNVAQKSGFDYFLMEAFDQPWKSEQEGAVGAYWGVFDVDRNPKFAFTEPVVRIPKWRMLAAGSAVIGILVLSVLLVDGGSLRNRGRSFLAIVANCAAAATVWIIYDYGNQYLTPFTIVVGVLMIMGFVGITLVLLIEAHELAEASWVSVRRRLFLPATPENPEQSTTLPKVSVHVPAYNEPPAMMIATLDALSRLRYPNFEVVVIDNNTKDAEVWRPVEEHCRKLGSRFRFFHVDPLAGFKAGALNFAMANTAADAEIIAVIDSDYQVRPNWLCDLVPQFGDQEIGIVQAPQDYRDDGESLFKAMCYAEYEGFFHIGMVTRNDRNAIIQHGTMTMIRKSVLEEVGGWAEWCITEDAELGLRIFEKGYGCAYVEKSYGKGLIPDTFLDYKKQRFRWAYGAVQILRRHSRQLLGGAGESKLSFGQKYHFLAGWMPWLADGINLFFTLAALVWSAAIIISPLHVDPPLAVFTAPPLALFLFKVGKLVYLYRSRVKASYARTAAAAVAGLALSHTIAKAVVQGFYTTGKPFFRTPKCENSPAMVQAMSHVAEEAAIAVGLWISAAGVAIVQGRETPGSLFWSLVLIVQSMPYLAAVLLSLISALPGHQQRLPATEPGRPLSPAV
ncbi:MAG: glycosyltransferase [Thermodesulfobacteriota bacterium]